MKSAAYNKETFGPLAELAEPIRAKKGKVCRMVRKQGMAGDEGEALASYEEIVRQCPFMRHWDVDAAKLPEPEWYAGLTIVGRCKDGEGIAHDVSSRDPRYDPEETAKKLLHACEDTGPRTCRTLQAEFPACGGCRKPEWVKTPLQLGRQARVASGLDARLQELNTEHAVTLVGGKCVILREVTDPLTGRPDIALLSPSDFHTLHANNRIEVPAPRGVQLLPVSRLWLEWPGRREYKGIVFDPSDQARPGFYNLFRGLPVIPAQGDWKLYREHLRTVLCDGDKERFDYVLAWMARCVQDPGGQRPGVALVLLGKQGTGKGVFMKYLGALFGSHFLHLTSSQQLTGRFNSHLKDALLLFSDEGTWGGDKIAEGVLKGLITEGTIFVEPKGKDGFTVANHVNLVIASNNSWVIPAGLEERRYLVLRVSEQHMQDKPYFRAICDEMNNGGLAAMMYDLLRLDISAVDLRSPPRTEALFEQILQTMPSAARFWHQLLVDGVFPKVTEEFGKRVVNHFTSSSWESWCGTDDLHCAYLEFARGLNDRHPLSREVFTKELMKLCPGLGTSRRSAGLRRVSGLTIPPLEECRKAFADAVKFDVPWPIDDEEQEEGGRDGQPGGDGLWRAAGAPMEYVDSAGNVVATF